MELKAPHFWHYMLSHLFRVESQRLREALWRGYPKSTALVWQLQRCGEPALAEQITHARVKQLSQHLDPAVLLHVADGLVPLGRTRPKDIIAFEEVVLRLTDKHGRFIWFAEGENHEQRRVAGAPAHRPA